MSTRLALLKHERVWDVISLCDHLACKRFKLSVKPLCHERDLPHELSHDAVLVLNQLFQEHQVVLATDDCNQTILICTYCFFARSVVFHTVFTKRVALLEWLACDLIWHYFNFLSEKRNSFFCILDDRLKFLLLASLSHVFDQTFLEFESEKLLDSFRFQLFLFNVCLDHVCFTLNNYEKMLANFASSVNFRPSWKKTKANRLHQLEHFLLLRFC